MIRLLDKRRELQKIKIKSVFSKFKVHNSYFSYYSKIILEGVSMQYILFLLLPISLFATASFITPAEYSAQLYKNPRGIGCQKCHGDNGEGKLIANYKHKGVAKSFRGPKINTLSYGEFYKALNRRKNGMPRYFLTDKEVAALYLHLHKNDKKDTKVVK